MSKIIDLTIWMDGLKLEDGETADTVIEYLEKKYPLPYGYEYEVTYEESLAT